MNVYYAYDESHILYSKEGEIILVQTSLSSSLLYIKHQIRNISMFLTLTSCIYTRQEAMYFVYQINFLNYYTKNIYFLILKMLDLFDINVYTFQYFLCGYFTIQKL
jgi:hypothetical protein